MTLTGAAPTPTTIVFGTDGWRARIADEFTYDNVRRCADGVAAYVTGRGEAAKGVVIAYDRRFSSEYFAMAAAEVLLAHDIGVAFAVHAVPTQMSSYEVVERGSAAGIVITASHNPWVDNGFKVKAPTGAAAGAEILSVIESRLAVNGGVGIARRPFADAEAAGMVERYDPFEGYERFVRRTVDLDALKGGRHVGPGRPDVGGRQRLVVAPARRRPDPGRRDPPGTQSRTSAGSTPNRSARTSTRRSGSWRRAATTSASSSTAMRTGRVRPMSRGRSSTSSRSPAC